MNDIVINNACKTCANYIQSRTCFAFIYIPDIIWLGENNHRQNVNGDKRIKYEPLEITTQKRIENS